MNLANHLLSTVDRVSSRVGFLNKLVDTTSNRVLTKPVAQAGMSCKPDSARRCSSYCTSRSCGLPWQGVYVWIYEIYGTASQPCIVTQMCEDCIGGC